MKDVLTVSDGKKNPYAVLGVKRDATTAELREAFQELALRHHPDRAGGETRLFQEIAAAYKVLSEPEARARYDRESQPRPGRPSPVAPCVPEPLIPGTSPRPRPSAGGPLGRPQVEARLVRPEQILVVDRQTATWGGEVALVLLVPSACPFCGGLLPDPLCICAGSGRIRRELPLRLRLPPLIQDGAVLPLEIPGVGVIELGIQVR
jgi:molecular chaperone DnaJ